jgi:hypothetical protein
MLRACLLRGRPVRGFSSLLDKPIIPAVVEDNKNTRFDYATKSYRYLPGFSFPAPRSLEQVVKPQLLERGFRPLRLKNRRLEALCQEQRGYFLMKCALNCQPLHLQRDPIIY